MDKFFIGEDYLTLENKRIVELKYFVLEKAKIVEETGEKKKCYGILVEKWNGEELENDFVNDITTEKEKVMRITNCLMKNKITPIHLKDILEDML